MNYQKLIICDFNELFIILNELKKELNFEVVNTSKVMLLNVLATNKNDYLVVTKKTIPNINNQILIDKFPLRLSKLIEKLNIEFLKKNFNAQSEVNIGKYKMNLNSRVLLMFDKELKLTEKEATIILYLSRSHKPTKIEELQVNVWGHKSELETHTVETHIYRLRKKISRTFKDNKFIISQKNGYQIN